MSLGTRTRRRRQDTPVVEFSSSANSLSCSAQYFGLSYVRYFSRGCQRQGVLYRSRQLELNLNFLHCSLRQLPVSTLGLPPVARACRFV